VKRAENTAKQRGYCEHGKPSSNTTASSPTNPKVGQGKREFIVQKKSFRSRSKGKKGNENEKKNKKNKR
jgi:hypothetical protein